MSAAEARPDWAREIKRTLWNPRAACEALGLMDRAKRQAGDGIQIRCPAHGEKNPSCSVTRGPDGTIRWRCFSCDASGDLLTLVAVVRGLELRSQFREVLLEAAMVAGHWEAAAALRGDRPEGERRPAPVRPEPPPVEPRTYPDPAEVEALWVSAGPVSDDRSASRVLVGRRLDPSAIDQINIARVVPEVGTWPDWARYGRKTWGETGHRMLLRVFDATGKCRSVRAWRIDEGPDELPKRLPPKGHLSEKLVLANRRAVGMLLGLLRPKRLVIVEGEPDFVRACLTWPAEATIGVGSGWWSPEFVERLPRQMPVVIWTDPDQAGERYAEQITESIGERCPVFRGGVDG